MLFLSPIVNFFLNLNLNFELVTTWAPVFLLVDKNTLNFDQLTYNCAWQGLSVYEMQNGLNDRKLAEKELPAWLLGTHTGCTAASPRPRTKYSNTRFFLIFCDILAFPGDFWHFQVIFGIFGIFGDFWPF